MHAPFAYWRKRYTENAFYTVKAKCSKCKRHFFIMIPLVLKNHICLVVELIINI